MEDEILKEALKKVMEDELNNLPDDEYLKQNYRFSDDFELKMQKLIKSTNRRCVTIGRQNVRRVMFIALIVIFTLTGCMCIKPIREAIINFFVEIRKEESNISFDYNDTTDTVFMPIAPEVPQGYVLQREDLWEKYYEIEYENSEGLTIRYIQMIPTGASVSINTEDTQLYDININGYEGVQYSKFGTNNILWTDEEYFYDLSGTCDMSDLEKVALSIKN